MAAAQQRGDCIDNRHEDKPWVQHRFNFQDHARLNSTEKVTPTTMVAEGGDNACKEDIRQYEHLTPRQEGERHTSFDRRQASVSGLPHTKIGRAPPNRVDQSYIPMGTTTQTVLPQDQPGLNTSLEEYLQLPQADRHRLRALFSLPIPLVPKEEPSKVSLLERLNPFRRIRSLSMLPAYRAIVFIPSENSGHARRRSRARRA
ncbi:hypothetical protein EV363DRAFT_1152587 [Boletus edulis]|uniref:Uncharacterized protein n=1 Tax=Boletus edulis BED1 TaxID=1328754 RepID=A0AAD4GJ29_BOLED|nr:hypothetical protein EV363DRAFT_1152587 [Boletus edulis]KAF8445560.1 hypothetical protein L210DRAFT_2917337 [Boletus edulis BED1]